MAGYTATGAQFKNVTARIIPRNPAQYAGVIARFSYSVQLWSSDLVVTLGIRASTSGTGSKGYTPYTAIYDRSTHQVIASNPNALWCDYHSPCVPVPPGEPVFGYGFYGVSLITRYSPATGHLVMAAYYDPGTSFISTYTVTPHLSFTQARVGPEFGSSPWDASYSHTPPATRVKIARYFDVSLTSYSGHKASLSSWWVHHKLLAKPSGSDLVAVPHDLYNGGASFQTWLVP